MKSNIYGRFVFATAGFERFNVRHSSTSFALRLILSDASNCEAWSALQRKLNR